MAKDDAEHSTPSPATRDLLSLNQAVALIVARLPPHDTDAVQTAMRNALADGRLRDCCVLGDDFDQSGSTAPDTWRRWFEEDRVNLRTGEVYFPPRSSLRDNLKVLKPPLIRPQFQLQDVLDLFGITEAPTSTAAPDQPARTTTAAEEVDKKATSTEPGVYQQIRELTKQEFPDGHKNVSTGVIIDRVSKRWPKGQPVPKRDTFDRALGRRKKTKPSPI
jgi:hypothetical protein